MTEMSAISKGNLSALKSCLVCWSFSRIKLKLTLLKKIH